MTKNPKRIPWKIPPNSLSIFKDPMKWSRIPKESLRIAEKPLKILDRRRGGRRRQWRSTPRESGQRKAADVMTTAAPGKQQRPPAETGDTTDRWLNGRRMRESRRKPRKANNWTFSDRCHYSSLLFPLSFITFLLSLRFLVVFHWPHRNCTRSLIFGSLTILWRADWRISCKGFFRDSLSFQGTIGGFSGFFTIWRDSLSFQEMFEDSEWFWRDSQGFFAIWRDLERFVGGFFQDSLLFQGIFEDFKRFWRILRDSFGFLCHFKGYLEIPSDFEEILWDSLSFSRIRWRDFMILGGF